MISNECSNFRTDDFYKRASDQLQIDFLILLRKDEIDVQFSGKF